MIAGREAPPVASRELRAAGLAALAEACVLALPIRGVLSQAADPFPLMSATVSFVAAYVGGTLLACVFRSSRALASGAVVAALLAGVGIGGGGARLATVALITLLVAVRVVALGVRDWRIPIGAEIPLGGAALGVQVVIAAAARPDWSPLLAVLVPVFFAASLASRASAVWTPVAAGELDPRVRSAWLRGSVVATTAILVGAVVIAFGSLRGGVLGRVGEWFAPVWDVVVAAIVSIVALAARPLFWLIERLGANPEALRELLARLRAPGPVSDVADGGGAELWQRMLGALVFVLLGLAIYRVLRRFRPKPARAERPPPSVSGS